MSERIHFLNTGHSDCIIIESDGHFAMIDAAEDTDFPADKPRLNLKGYEKEVCDYLIKNCLGKDGFVTLDFILGTHCHSDHIGGFDTVINNPKIKVKKAFLKPYHEENVFILERKNWDNQEVYEEMLGAIKDKNIPLVESFDNLSASLGKWSVKFFNGEYKKPKHKFGENANSVVTLLEGHGIKILLAGDMNYRSGLETKIRKAVGKVNLLKVGHHGYFGSTSFKFAKTLLPEYSVVCNNRKRIYKDVAFKLEKIAKSKILCTADENGVLATVTDNGIQIRTNIM